jgi:hypothetical protein
MTPLPESLSVLDAGRLAAKARLLLIFNGHESCLSPVVLPGWFRLAVKIKPGSGEKGDFPCAV